MNLTDFEPRMRVRALVPIPRSMYQRGVPSGTMGTVKLVASGDVFVEFDGIGTFRCKPTTLSPL